MKKCDFCKCDCADESVICPHCGAKFVTYCAHCGAENDSDACFCCRCGRPLAQPEFFAEPLPPVKKPHWGIIWAAFFMAFIVYVCISLFI